MSEPFHASNWTGDLTYRVGASSVTSDYEMLLRAGEERERERRNVPPEVARAIRATVRLALVVMLSPVLLWVAWLVLRSATRDFLLQDNSYVLLASGACTIGMAALLCMSWGGRNLFWLRKAGLMATLLATVGVSIGYAYLGLSAHTHAATSAPERVFAVYNKSGKGRFERSGSRHQRADGTIIEDGSRVEPWPYAYTCELVQRLNGDYGFSWVRVVDRSQAPANEIPWPIRREDCFGEKPVSSLRG